MSVLDETSIFATIVQEGGFGKAAKKLGYSNGLISRKIKSLEERLGISLLNRTTRTFSLTKEGELYYKHAERMQRELEAGLSLIHSASDKPKGHIRITTAVHYTRYLTPVVCEFMQEFPEITVEIIATNVILDPFQHHIDIMFRTRGWTATSPSDDANLKGRFLGDYIIGLYASPAYLAQYGEPRHPADLAHHRTFGYSRIKLAEAQLGELWPYDREDEHAEILVHPHIRIDDVGSKIEACKAGLGIARFADISVVKEMEDKSLRKILNDYCWGKSKMYLLYPYQSGIPKRVRLLLDYIIARLAVHNS